MKAVDLAKRFCDGSAPRIINGCLRTFVQDQSLSAIREQAAWRIRRKGAPTLIDGEVELLIEQTCIADSLHEDFVIRDINL